VSQKRFAPVTIETAAPDLPAAAEILRDYLGEMISRYYNRPTDDAEINQHLSAGHGSDDLVEPTGVLLLAQSADDDAQPRPIGCVGLRRLDEHTRELTRMFVRPEARGAGVAALLLAAAEQRARADGASVIRLNTRNDLVEARALYAKHGYQEIPRYGDDPLAEHWFEKKL
jgi:GNAT superfamily N-acetyltransferase